MLTLLFRQLKPPPLCLATSEEAWDEAPRRETSLPLEDGESAGLLPLLLGVAGGDAPFLSLSLQLPCSCNGGCMG